MKQLFFLIILLSNSLSASDTWIEENIYKKQDDGKNRAEEETWFKENLKKILSESKKYDLTEIKANTDKILARSVPCKTSVGVYEDYTIYILMTFDLPEALWSEYSPILEKIGGAFVVRGLPNDSFIEFSKKIKIFREKGITAPVQLNPKLFEKYQVELSPSILLLEGDRYDKITGTVSITYALEQFEKFGDTNTAAGLQAKLFGGIH